VYLWLVPGDSDAAGKKLADVIEASGGPKFAPHVTLAILDTKDSVEELVAKLRKFSASLPQNPIVANFSGVTTGTTFHQSVFLSVDDKDGALAKLNKEALAAFGSSASGAYNPHLSVFYGEDKARDAVKGKLAADATLISTKSLTFSTIQLVLGGGDLPSGWTQVGRAQVGTDRFFRDANFIDGTWRNTATGKRIDVVNPATKKVFHSVPDSNADDVDAAVKAADRAFPAWAALSAQERAAFLVKIAEELLANRKQMAEIEVLDNGKPWNEGDMDIGDTADTFKYYANLVVEREKEQDRTIDVGNPSFECFIRREPVGVCGLVIPWNYPLLMAAWKVAPCLAAGCTCVLKPSENTSLSALELAAIADRVGLPKGVLNVVTGYGPTVGSPLVDHPLVHKVAFTGSVATGSKVALKAASSIKKCSLELGGKSPIIVFNDADVDQVVDWISVGIFFNAGQVCSATSRLLIQEGIKDQVLSKLAEVAKKIKIGSGLDPTNKLGPVVNDIQYKKIVDFIKGGLAQGATPLVGGVPAESDGYFVNPTVFVNVKPEMTIWREEIFGPVLSVVTFKDADEALRLANNTDYGLAAAIMSKSQDTCRKMARGLEAGIVWVNCSQPTFVQAPWGGYKQTGVGRELGPWGLENYLETKQVSTWIDDKAKGWGWFTG